MLFFSTSVLNQLQNEVCTMLVLAHLNIGWILVLHQLYTLRCPEFVYAHPGPPKYRMDSSTKPTIQIIVEWSVYHVSTSPPKCKMDFNTPPIVHLKVSWSVYYANTRLPRYRMEFS